MINQQKSPFSELKNKTGKHKDWYSIGFIKIFCNIINSEEKLFSNSDFVKDYKREYLKLELKQRLNLISDLLLKYLDFSYRQQLKILSSLFGRPWPYEEGMFTYGFYLYPVSQFVERNGLNDIQLSLRFIEKLTMQFTGEWAIRPIANFNEKKTLKQMKEWSKSDNLHVRRLSSEGLRARLPWGQKIEWIQRNPEKSLPIYNKLRNDKVLYVRRSVANSMGDIIKINEDLAINTFHSWLTKKKTLENLWVIKHAIRTPVKKESKTFLKLNNVIKKEIKKIER